MKPGIGLRLSVTSTQYEAAACGTDADATVAWCPPAYTLGVRCELYGTGFRTATECHVLRQCGLAESTRVKKRDESHLQDFSPLQYEEAACGTDADATVASCALLAASCPSAYTLCVRCGLYGARVSRP